MGPTFPSVWSPRVRLRRKCKLARGIVLRFLLSSVGFCWEQFDVGFVLGNMTGNNRAAHHLPLGMIIKSCLWSSFGRPDSHRILKGAFQEDPPFAPLGEDSPHVGWRTASYASWSFSMACASNERPCKFLRSSTLVHRASATCLFPHSSSNPEPKRCSRTTNCLAPGGCTDKSNPKGFKHPYIRYLGPKYPYRMHFQAKVFDNVGVHGSPGMVISPLHGDSSTLSSVSGS